MPRIRLVRVSLILAIGMLTFFGYRYHTREISLFDLPGMNSHSPRLWSIMRGLNMRQITESSVEYCWLKQEFPHASEFYGSSTAPLLMIMRDGFVDLVRIGDRVGLQENSHTLDPLIQQKIDRMLARLNVDYPYELMLCGNHESAMRVLLLPYWGTPSIAWQGKMSKVDFRSERGAPYRVTAYWASERLVGFDLHARDQD